MRYLLVIFILFFSHLSFSASDWIGRSAFKYQESALTYCSQPFNNSTNPANPVAWKIEPYNDEFGNKYKCYTNDNPCDSPEEWDQVTFTCRLPCPSGQIITRQFSPAVNVVCISGCAANQSSDSTCTGTAIEGGICTAQFTTTGAFCPNANADNSTPPTDTGGGGDTGGGDTGGGDTGGGDTGGGDTGGGDTGGGDTGGGDTGGGDTGGGDTGGGNTGGGNTGSGNGVGSAAGGFTCEAPPVCEVGPDSATCAILHQQWRQRCPNTELDTNPNNGDGVYDANDHELNIVNRLQQQKDRYTDKVNEIKDALQAQLSLSVSGGGSLMCNPQQIFGQSIDLSICARLDFLNLISGLFMAVAVVLSAYIVLAPRG